MDEIIESLKETFLQRNPEIVAENELQLQSYTEEDYGRIIYPDATLRDYYEINLHPISFDYLKKIAKSQELIYALDLIGPMLPDDPNDLLSYNLYKFLFSSLLDSHSVLFSIETYKQLKTYILDLAKKIIQDTGQSPCVFFLARLGFIGGVNYPAFSHYAKFTKFLNYIVADGKVIPYSYISQNQNLEKIKMEIAMALYEGQIDKALDKAILIDNKGVKAMVIKVIRGGFYG